MMLSNWPIGHRDDEVAILSVVLPIIDDLDHERIGESLFRKLERDAVPAVVAPSFGVVPLEIIILHTSTA